MIIQATIKNDNLEVFNVIIKLIHYFISGVHHFNYVFDESHITQKTVNKLKKLGFYIQRENDWGENNYLIRIGYSHEEVLNYIDKNILPKELILNYNMYANPDVLTLKVNDLYFKLTTELDYLATIRQMKRLAN